MTIGLLSSSFLLLFNTLFCLRLPSLCMLFSGGLFVISRLFRRCSWSSATMSLPGGACDERRLLWSSSNSLARFVWAFRLGSGLGPCTECDRAALAVWFRKLDLSVSRDEKELPPLSADEAMLDWLVSSVRLGWTTREVLNRFFTVFGDLLFRMISDVSERA